MRKDYGIYLYCLLLCILAIFFQKNHRGYAEFISDWRGIGCVDYSSNMIVCNYYNPGKAKWLREQSRDEIIKRLNAGEVLTVGIDYYALYGITRPLVPTIILKKADQVIRNGGVYVYKMRK